MSVRAGSGLPDALYARKADYVTKADQLEKEIEVLQSTIDTLLLDLALSGLTRPEKEAYQREINRHKLRLYRKIEQRSELLRDIKSVRQQLNGSRRHRLSGWFKAIGDQPFFSLGPAAHSAPEPQIAVGDGPFNGKYARGKSWF